MKVVVKIKYNFVNLYNIVINNRKVKTKNQIFFNLFYN
jgi:hypothetical protein